MRGSSGASEPGSATIKEAARPLCIVITNEEGRCGVRYDTDARNAAYDRTSSILSEALGSVSAPAEVSEEEWRAALSGPGVYFSYITPVKLSVLDGWLGARMPDFSDDPSLRRICVAFGEDRSRIYFQDFESGLYYGADTASSAGKAQELGIFSANGALFAFETDITGAENAPYLVLMQGSDHPDIHAGAAGNTEDLLNLTLTALGHSNETYRVLPDGTDAIRCIGTQFNIRLDLHGRTLYRRTDVQQVTGDTQTQSESELIERARLIIADTIVRACGDAEVFFESIVFGARDYCSVYFGYYIAGGRVILYEDENAARVTFMSGVVTEVELCFRHFSFSEAYTALLPEIQTLAAAGGEFMLCYSDAGAETIQPAWIRKS